MKKKPYSDPRWWDNPMPSTSLCYTCKYELDPENCEKRGKIPSEIFDKSFPRCRGFDENYCQYREEKTE